jgi:biopolymer transport protein ExbD
VRRIECLRLGLTGKRWEPKIGIAPLIDMVFILLIFFLVTTSFVRETGITVNRPVAVTAQTLEKQSILIGVTERGTIHINQRQVDLSGLRAEVKKALRRRPSRPVVIIADRGVDLGRVVDVMDSCKLAGARKTSLASRKK